MSGRQHYYGSSLFLCKIANTNSSIVENSHLLRIFARFFTPATKSTQKSIPTLKFTRTQKKKRRKKKRKTYKKWWRRGCWSPESWPEKEVEGERRSSKLQLRSMETGRTAIKNRAIERRKKEPKESKNQRIGEDGFVISTHRNGGIGVKD